MADSPTLLIPPEVLEPLVRRVVEEALRRLDEIKGTLPERLAFRETEAARLLGLNPHQLRDARLRGEIEANVGPGRLILYRHQQLVAYLLSRPWSAGD
jgi:hypothetical protein